MSGLSFRQWVGMSAAGALLLALVVPVAEASAATSSRTVAVPATQPWTDTGIALSAGTVSFKASGTINVQSGNPAFNNTPAGQGPADPGCIGNSDTPWGDDWTAEGLPCWSLIGRIGDGSPFEIGDAATFTVSSPGELYLGVNDQATAFGDNSGSWTVQASWTSSSPSCTYTSTVTFSPSSGRAGTTFTITGHNWVPGGTVTSTPPHGSPEWFTGYQTPTVNSNGGFSYKETVGTGPGGPTPAGTYTFKYVEKYGGCSLSFHQEFTVNPSPSPSCARVPRNPFSSEPELHMLSLQDRIQWWKTINNSLNPCLLVGLTPEEFYREFIIPIWLGEAIGPLFAIIGAAIEHIVEYVLPTYHIYELVDKAWHQYQQTH